MRGHDNNFGMPDWIRVSTDEAILSEYNAAQSVVCRRAARPAFPLATMRRSITRLGRDIRLNGRSTLHLLSDLICSVEVSASAGVIVNPVFGQNNMHNDFAIKIYDGLKPGAPMRIHHLLGIGEKTWLAQDIENAIRHTTKSVFPGYREFTVIFRTRTVRGESMHMDSALSLNYGPKTTCVASLDDIESTWQAANGSGGDEDMRYLPKLGSTIALEPGDIAKIMHPHGTPVTPEPFPLESRLMVGIQPPKP